MQLEAGKFYKTRDGRKAFVGAVNPPFEEVNDDEQAIGWIDGQRCSYGWEKDGRHIKSSETHSEDLVSEWIDQPQEITVDGVVYVRKQ